MGEVTVDDDVGVEVFHFKFMTAEVTGSSSRRSRVQERVWPKLGAG